jgi:hypothetical protein
VNSRSNSLGKNRTRDLPRHSPPSARNVWRGSPARNLAGFRARPHPPFFAGVLPSLAHCLARSCRAALRLGLARGRTMSFCRGGSVGWLRGATEEDVPAPASPPARAPRRWRTTSRRVGRPAPRGGGEGSRVAPAGRTAVRWRRRSGRWRSGGCRRGGSSDACAVGCVHGEVQEEDGESRRDAANSQRTRRPALVARRWRRSQVAPLLRTRGGCTGRPTPRGGGGASRAAPARPLYGEVEEVQREVEIWTTPAGRTLRRLRHRPCAWGGARGGRRAAPGCP